MSNRIPPATFRKLDRILRRLGFEPRRGRGSHVVYRHPDGRTATLTNHRGKEIGPEIIQDILKDIGLSRDNYLAMR